MDQHGRGRGPTQASLHPVHPLPALCGSCRPPIQHAPAVDATRGRASRDGPASLSRSLEAEGWGRDELTNTRPDGVGVGYTVGRK